MALLRLYCSRGGPLLARGFPSRSALLSFSLSELGPTLFAFSSSSSSISSSHALYFNLFRAAARSQKRLFLRDVDDDDEIHFFSLSGEG